MEDKLPKVRGNNFSSEELIKLQELLEKYPIILNKKTDSTSSKQNEEAWRILALNFNSNNLVYRTKKQLINKFNNMKITASKEFSQDKRERRCTSEWLCTIMGESIVGLPFIYDSDLTQDNNKNEQIFEAIEIQGIQDDDFVKPADLPDDQLLSVISCEAASTHKDNVVVDTQEQQEHFDTSTPMSMLKKPVSKALVPNNRKRRLPCTPLGTRKKIVTMAHEKENYFKGKAT